MRFSQTKIWRFFQKGRAVRRSRLSLCLALALGHVRPALAQSANAAGIGGVQSETVNGRNTTGPYTLAWRNIRPGSETVDRNGVLLRRGTDYFFDASAGMIAFVIPLRASDNAHLSYRSDLPDSAPNSAAAAAALDLDVWKSGQNRLFLHSYFDPKNSVSGSAPVSLLQWVGSARYGSRADMASALYFDLHGGDWLGRSGMRFSERTKSKTSDVGFSYARAGAQFVAPEDSGLQTGTEILEAKGKFIPQRGLTLLSSLKQTTLIADAASAASGGVTRSASGSLSYALPDGKVEAGRDLTQTVAADGAKLLRTTDTAKIESAIAPRTTASVQYESQTAQSVAKDDSSATFAQKSQIGFQTRIWQPLSLSGSFRSATGTSGGQDTASLKMELTPFAAWRALRVTTNWEDRYRDSGAERLREGMLELPTLPIARLRLSGGFRETYGLDADRMTGLLNAELAPLPFLEISGGARFRDGTLANSQPDPDFSDGYQVKVALAPVKKFRLTGSMSRNPDRDDGKLKRLESQAFGLETEFGSFQFRGQAGIDNEYLANRLTRTMDLNLALRLSRFDTLTTGFQGRLLDGAALSGTSTYLFAYTRRVGPVFDLSLSGKMIRNEGDGIAAADRTEYKAEAKLGIHF